MLNRKIIRKIENNEKEILVISLDQGTYEWKYLIISCQKQQI